MWLGDQNQDNFLDAVHSMINIVIVKSNGTYSTYVATHKEQVFLFLAKALAEVKSEQKQEGGDFIDDDIQVAHLAKTYVTCIACKAQVLHSKGKCTNENCREDLKRSKEVANNNGQCRFIHPGTSSKM